MFAIVEIGGNQYKVEKGNFFDVEKIEAKDGSKVTFDKIFLVQKDDGETLIGDPLVKGAKIEAEILGQTKDDKIIIFKKRRRHNSRRKTGHRQKKTTIKILSIVA